MPEHKITPGPWTVVDDEIHTKKYRIAVIAADDGEIGNDNLAQADAQAIAAVPELLALCEAVLKYLYPTHPSTAAERDRIHRLAETAALKAYGIEGLRRLLGDVLREADNA